MSPSSTPTRCIVQCLVLILSSARRTMIRDTAPELETRMLAERGDLVRDGTRPGRRGSRRCVRDIEPENPSPKTWFALACAQSVTGMALAQVNARADFDPAETFPGPRSLLVRTPMRIRPNLERACDYEADGRTGGEVVAWR